MKLTRYYHTVKNNNKLLSLAVVVALVLTIPPTLSIAQKVLNIRQYADSNTAVISVNPTTAKPGSTITVGWTIDQSSTTTITGAETLQLMKPPCSSNTECHSDTNALAVVGNPIYLSCNPVYNGVDRNIPPSSPIYIGQCTFSLPSNAVADYYIVRMYASDATTILGESPQITTGGEGIPVINTNPSISAWPNPCMLSDYGTCSSMISWNVPNATDAASVTVKIKGINNSLFANAPFGIKKAGWITAGGATFELYIGSSTTPVSSVSVKGVDLITPPPFQKDKRMKPIFSSPTDVTTIPSATSAATP